MGWREFSLAFVEMSMRYDGKKNVPPSVANRLLLLLLLPIVVVAAAAAAPPVMMMIVVVVVVDAHDHSP